MNTRFYISLNLKTPGGIETYGRFELGNDRKAATALFTSLRGDENLSEQSLMQMELTEQTSGIPLPVAMLHCTLDDLAHNTRLITRETFKRHHLGKDLHNS